MKTIRLPLLLSLGLLLPLGSSAQETSDSSSPPPSPSNPADAGTSTTTATAGGITVITEDDLEGQATAVTVLGSTLTDPSGQSIGQISDFDLTALLTDSPDTEGEATAALLVTLEGDSANDGALLVIPLHEVQVENAQVSINATREEIQRSVGREDGQLASTTTERATTAATAGSADQAAAPSTPRAIGDPANDPANTLAPVAVAAPAGTETDLQVATTGVEVEQIQQALRQSEQTKGYADQIGVLSATEAVLLTGQLQDEGQREQVLNVVREATQREVVDLMAVGAAAE